MRKILAWCLAAALVLPLAACGKGEPAQSAAGSKPAAPASSAVSGAESQPESEPESESASSAASEEEKTASSRLEQENASSGASSAARSSSSDIKTLAGGSAQGGAVSLSLEQMTKTLVEKSNVQQWYYFTTGDQDAYEVLLAPGGQYGQSIVFQIYNSRGEELWEEKTKGDGSVTVSQLQLTPKTTYYVALVQSIGGGELTFCISPMSDGKAAGLKGTTAAAQEKKPTDTAAILEQAGGDAQIQAVHFPLEQKVKTVVERSNYRLWYCFTTGEQTQYEVQMAPGGQYGQSIVFRIYNSLGEQLWEEKTKGDGSMTLSQIQLAPKTTYYVALVQSIGGGELTFSISAGNTQGASVSEIQREPEQLEDLIFEEPFSLDETQIMFVSNKAVFVDEEAAKAALAPVAEVILAHPDHPVLLAGTTATDGEQESCVQLSSQRAEAVKNLLVSAYGVPADQLLTVGLGYAADPFPRGQDRDSKGNFVESEAVKNRRVVVLDANDPTAQAILNA